MMYRLPMLMQLKSVLSAYIVLIVGLLTPIFLFQVCLKFLIFGLGVIEPDCTGPFPRTQGPRLTPPMGPSIGGHLLHSDQSHILPAVFFLQSSSTSTRYLQCCAIKSPAGCRSRNSWNLRGFVVFCSDNFYRTIYFTLRWNKIEYNGRPTLNGI